MSNVDLEGSPLRAARHAEAALGTSPHGFEGLIQRSPWGAFSILTLLFVAAVVVLSGFKLLWLDELITLHIARQGSIAAIWDSLAQGADPNPPITHILVHESRLAFGDHELSYRLPAIAGYWVGLVSLFAYLLRRVPPIWALAGTVLSMTMAAFEYSFESRSYAIFYGLAMLAVFCWSVTVDLCSRAVVRNLALAGMVFALAAGISTNYFAVLAFLPIAGGELARTASRMMASSAAPRRALLRAIDPRIWFGLALAGSTLLAYRSMIAHSIAEFAPHAWNKVSIGQVFDSYTEMVEIVLYPILALFVFALVLYFISRKRTLLNVESLRAGSRRWIDSILLSHPGELPAPLHEAIAIFLLMAYPILGYIVASARGGMLSPRFVIPVCFGFAIAATFVAFRLFCSLPRAGMVMLCFCLAWFIARETVVGYMYSEQKQAFNRILDRVSQAQAALPAGAPIAIPDPLLALTFQHYAPRSLVSRVVFPVDFPAIRHFRHDDSPEENLWAGRNSLYTLPILPLAQFQHPAHKYLLIANDSNWLLEDLRLHHYPVQKLPIDTHAEAIGGFTPLAHGIPFFFIAEGDAAPVDNMIRHHRPQPFRVADNLPDSQAIIPQQTGGE